MAQLESQARAFGKTLLGQTSPKKAVIANIVTGTGVDVFLRRVDNIFGSPIQKLFGFNVPFLGNVGLIDFANYVIHTGGKVTKNVMPGLVAVGGAKAIEGTLPLLSGTLAIPGLSSSTSNPGPSAAGAPL